MITIKQFAEIEIKVGLVVEAINKEGSEKLIRLKVRFEPESIRVEELESVSKDERIIFTGVRTYGFTPEDFLNKKFLFVTNLEYKKMMDEESQGMILAVGNDGERPIFVEMPDAPVGSKVR